MIDRIPSVARRWVGPGLWGLWAAVRVATIGILPARPDPREALLAQAATDWAAGVPPDIFHWPGVPWLFLWRLAVHVGVESPEALVRLMRLVGALCGVAMVGVLYRLARRWGLRRPGWGVALVALTPALSAGEGLLALVDAPALLLGTLGLLFATEGQPFLAGLTIGLGGAVKLPTLALALPALILVGRRPRRLAETTVGIGIGFLLGFPQLFSTEARADLLYELGHYRKGHFGLFPTAGEPLWAPIGRHLIAAGWGLGFLGAGALVVVLILGALGYLRWARTPPRPIPPRAQLALWAWLLVMLLPIGVQRFSFPRHWLAVAPAGAFLVVQRLPIGLVGGILFHQALMVLALNGIARQPSTLDRLAADLHALREERPQLRLTYGPQEPVFRWLYPEETFQWGSALPADAADWAVVAELEAQVQTQATEHPERFRPADFFPLRRFDFTTGPFFSRVQKTGVLTRRYAVSPPRLLQAAAWWGGSPPFPVNALHHPTLLLYRLERIRAAKTSASN